MSYPSWRYHRNGKSFVVTHPDLEPQGLDWDSKPWPIEPPKPVLNECCKALKAKFDAAWENIQADRAEERAKFDDELRQKTDECAALQAKLDAALEPKPRKK